MTLDLLQPNKTDAINYLDKNASAPTRYAQATLSFGATTDPYFQEYMVGPLPVSSKTTVQELNYIYNSGKGKQRIYNQDAAEIAELQYSAGKAVASITQKLLNGVCNPLFVQVLQILIHYRLQWELLMTLC